MAEIHIPTYEELLESLPVEFRTPEVMQGKDDPPYHYRSLKENYDIEVERIKQYAERCQDPYARLGTFIESKGQHFHQFSATFIVNDQALPQRDQYNFHGMNMSQCKYAGCILVDNNRVTTHH